MSGVHADSLANEVMHAPNEKTDRRAAWGIKRHSEAVCREFMFLHVELQQRVALHQDQEIIKNDNLNGAFL